MLIKGPQRRKMKMSFTNQIQLLHSFSVAHSISKDYSLELKLNIIKRLPCFNQMLFFMLFFYILIIFLQQLQLLLIIIIQETSFMLQSLGECSGSSLVIGAENGIGVGCSMAYRVCSICTINLGKGMNTFFLQPCFKEQDRLTSLILGGQSVKQKENYVFNR